MRSFDDGFTVLEMLVAAGIAVLMMSLAMVALTGTMRAHKRSRMLLIEEEEARSALMRIRRDVEGVFEATGNGSYFQIVRDSGNNTDTLQLVCATENRGPSDYVRVRYHVPQLDPDPNHHCLVRETLVWPFTGEPQVDIVARSVRRVWFLSNGSSPPEQVKVTLSMKETHEGLQLFEIRRYEETMNVPVGP